MNSHYWCIQKKKVFYSLKLVWAFLNNFFSGIGQFMRDMSLPEQNEDILKCMLSSSVLPIPNIDTGKSLSEALNLASTNPQYDKRLFIDLPVLA